MNTLGKTFKVFNGMLSEVPGGAIAINIPPFSEGLLVEFFRKDGSSWVGNFGKGITNTNEIMEFPERGRTIVISGGQMYILNPEDSNSANVVKGLPYSMGEVLRSDFGQYITHDFTEIYIIEANGDVYISERISFDGIEDLKIVGEVLSGLSYNPMNSKEEWCPFSINLVTKQAEGGSYPQILALNPGMARWEPKVI